MRLGEVNPSVSRHYESTGHRTEPSGETHASESRALVTLAPSFDAAAEAQPGYRNVAFLAQLIATKDQHPQTRERRRAEPTDVLAAYRATAALGHS
jgi:hypothetical protein